MCGVAVVLVVASVLAAPERFGGVFVGARLDRVEDLLAALVVIGLCPRVDLVREFADHLWSTKERERLDHPLLIERALRLYPGLEQPPRELTERGRVCLFSKLH